jgi:succinate dehydrogenase / fumarate reductase, cytochrome b subunit
MNKCACFFTSTLGKKVTMAVTGLLLIGFLVVHLIGNLTLFPAFGGQEKFNAYAHLLSSTPLIYGAEALLLAIFLIHIVAAIQVSLKNKAARPVAYEVRNTFGKSNAYSRGMLHTGLTVLLFLVLHLVTFKFGKEYQTVVDGVEIRDLYKTVTELFAIPSYSAFYIIAMIVMGLHLMHAFKSACQTLGLFHAKWNGLFARISVGLAIFFALGYSSFPIYFGFIKGSCSTCDKPALSQPAVTK